MDVEDLEDLIGGHQLDAHRYGTHVINTILKMLKRVDDRLSLQIYDALDGLTKKEKALLLANNFKLTRLKELRRLVFEMEQNLISVTKTVLGSEGSKYAEHEFDRAVKLSSAIGISGTGASLSSNHVYSAAMSRPMNGRHIRDFIKDLGVSHRKEIFAAINEGLILGEPTSKIMFRIRGTAEARRKDGLLYKRNGKIERLVVRSALNHISNVAAVESFKQMGVKEYYLSPVFDGRTSPVCRSLNASGVTYYKIGQGPLPPLHPGGCRTQALAKAGDKIHSRKPFIKDTRPVADIPKNQRGDKIGITNAPSFDAWLRRQPKSLQKEWLGETRYKLFNEGIKLDKFADPIKGKAYNLDQIKIRNKDAFEKLAA